MNTSANVPSRPGAHRKEVRRLPGATKSLDQLRGYWDKHARTYDKQMSFMERRFFADTRPWVCQQATGAVLEVAIGTGLNLQWYPRDIQLTGIDLSPVMLERASQRAQRDGRWRPFR
jgi:ubiquinone/menaquinone biosynthesis C-methylase UbiE